MTEVKPSLYYYKRWVWIQFPWACISLHNNYSQTPELCLTSATEYMSVETEAEFTRQALKIAIEARERKKLMFTQKMDGIEQSRRLLYKTSKSQFKSESGDLTRMKLSIRTGVFAAVKNISMNLQSLTKELELKRSKYREKTQSIKKLGFEASTFALTETKYKEGDFLDKRKVFTINNPNNMARN